MFELTAEQTLLQKTVNAYFHTRRDNRQPWSHDSWKTIASELGLQAVPFAEELGGIGGGGVEDMLIMQACGEHRIVQPYVQSVVTVGRILVDSDFPARAEMIKNLIAGDYICSLVGQVRRGDGTFSPPEISATPWGDGYRLNGRKGMVVAAPWSTHLIVAAASAGDAGKPLLFCIQRDREGISLRTGKVIDSYTVGDIEFVDVPVARLELISSGTEVLSLLELAEDCATAASCAEAVGLARAMLAQTLEYVCQREQFGVTLASFQVLRHRLVDMYVQIEHASSLCHAAALALSMQDADRQLLVSAAKVLASRMLNLVGRNAVQIHGAMGMMEETPVARYFKRATAIQHQHGTGEQHLQRFARFAGCSLPSMGAATNSASDIFSRLARNNEIDESLEAFVSEVREFLAEHLIGNLAERAKWETGVFASPELSRPWQQLLAQRGWAAPSWPVEHGGPGWTAAQRRIFAAEMEFAGAPRLPAMGIEMCGPVIMRFGTNEQKAFFLPRILSGEHYWCQGYSEPGSGSDLASVKLSAIRDGNDYILNGTKIWTTFAQYANWIFVLARTAWEGKPQAGISFILVPMDSPGITVQPLLSVSGEQEVNQVFFDNVRIPVANRVGEENDGWRVARYLLEFERGVGQQVPALVKRLMEVRERAIDCEGARWEDSSFKRRFAQLEIDVLAVRLTEERLVYQDRSAQSPGDAIAALMKLSWSETSHAVDELSLETLGEYAVADQGEAYSQHDAAKLFGPPQALTPLRRYLNDRAMTIAGGSSEVLRNILAKTALKL
ncbi:MAG: acyl-CoA dehydrogenase family protein [Tissierellales bacterium]